MKKIFIAFVCAFMLCNNTSHVEAKSKKINYAKHVLNCFEAEAKKNKVSLQQQLKNMGLVHDLSYNLENTKQNKAFAKSLNKELKKRHLHLFTFDNSKPQQPDLFSDLLRKTKLAKKQKTILAKFNNIDHSRSTKHFKKKMYLKKRKKAKKKKKKGHWVYLYTIDPYSFYRNTATHEIHIIQTTSTIDHLIHTSIEGSTTHSTSYPVPYYDARYKNLMGK